jgi:tetratricopeptide (TPR) repeat protein
MNRFIITLIILSAALQSFGQLIKTGTKAPDYRTLKQADKLWKDGDYVESEKLYRKAASEEHIFPLATLAKHKFEIGDVKGANQLYDEVIANRKRYAEGQSSQIYRITLNRYYFEKIEFNMMRGIPEVGIETALDFVESMGDKVTELERAYFQNVYHSTTEAAFALDNEDALVRLHRKAVAIKNGEFGEFTSFVYLSLLRKEYGKALARIEDVMDNGAGFTMSRVVAKSLLPVVLTHMGENDRALEAIKKSTSSVMIGEGYYQYLYGLIAMNKKDYPEAIIRLTNAIKGYKVLGIRVEPSGKYKHYTKRAEAYVALGDLVNARKDYEAALVHLPSYVPALNGVASLEGRMIAGRQTDKTPPQILITEPGVSRGLKVTSAGSEIMVRGKAQDASGLKSVTLNGKEVFSKEEGDFWGAVSLVNGVNKITVVATDLAGNRAEYVFDAERKESIAKVEDIVPVERKEGKNYAMLIASQNYDDSSIPSLENPIPDAVRLKMILKNSYNFSQDNILTLFNPVRSDFRKKFLELTELLKPEDNLIIFYAGHGIWVEKEKKGYWLLTDANRSDVNTWLPNKDVLDLIAEVPSRHTLLITDACFSGSVFKTRSIGADAPAAVREMSEKISRVAITSGNDTEVPDESVFMKYLVKALSENKEKYLTAQKMFINQIIEAVMEESKTEPRYGTLESAGHVGGDYIFTKN